MDCDSLDCMSITIDNVAEKLEEFKEKNRQSDCDKNMIDKLIDICNVQLERIKYLNNEKCEWTKMNCELQDHNRCVNNQLDDSKSELNKLQCELEQSRKKLKCVEKELCSSQVNNLYVKYSMI